MEHIDFIIGTEFAGQRVDKVITMKLGSEYSRMYVKFLIENGHVVVNNNKPKPKYLVAEGDQVGVELYALPEIDHVMPEDISLDVLYEDEWIIVINKPAGMVVHPGAGNKTGTLVNALMYYCGTLPDADDILRPGVVHRLDKDTSGVLVVAKTAKAMRSIAKQFQNRTVTKKYLALVKGIVEFDNGVIDAPIKRHSVNRKKMEVEPDEGKPARTIYHVIQRMKKNTLVSLDLETGRTHQIRVHMMHIGHPVAGDVVYGGREEGIERQILHSETLGFTHPGTGKNVEFTAPVPEDMRKYIEKAKNSN